MPVCVERSHPRAGRCCNGARRRHHNRWRMVGGGIPHQDDSKKVRNQEASDRGDPDLEKSGRILNRVTEWNRNGITIEADQRHVREILKGLELERITLRLHVLTGMMRTAQEMMKARERVEVDGGRPRPSTSGTDRRWQMTMPTTARHSQLVNRALVARISFLSQDRADLKFASMQVCCAMAKPSVRDMERVKRIGRYLAGKLRAKCWFRWQHCGELEA